MDNKKQGKIVISIIMLIIGVVFFYVSRKFTSLMHAPDDFGSYGDNFNLVSSIVSIGMGVMALLFIVIATINLIKVFSQK